MRSITRGDVQGLVDRLATTHARAEQRVAHLLVPAGRLFLRGTRRDRRAQPHPGQWSSVLRWGEAAGLKVGRIDFLRRTITVAEHRRDLLLLPPKSDAGRRTPSAPAWLIDELAALLRRRGVDGTQADRLVFTTAAANIKTA
jgi:hypothetical protein